MEAQRKQIDSGCYHPDHNASSASGKHRTLYSLFGNPGAFLNMESLSFVIIDRTKPGKWPVIMVVPQQEFGMEEAEAGVGGEPVYAD
jgi:hypothetical protein